MTMELIVGIIAFAFVVLVIFLAITLQTLCKTMKKVDRTLTEVQELTHNANKLTADIRKKTEALDFLFRPLYALNKVKTESTNGYDKISDIIEFVAEGVRLFGIIKNERKSHGK